MDNAEVYEYIKNLNSAAPQYLQDYAISKLVNLEESKLHLLLQPMSKSHWRNAAVVLKKIGYPRVKSILPGLLEWIQDMNWPGTEEIVDLLSTIDYEIVPYVKHVLKSGDGIWIIWTLSEVVSKWSEELRNLIKDNLLELSMTLDSHLIKEGVDIQSMKLLYESKSMDKEKVLSIVKRKSVLYQELLENLEEFKEIISTD
ncbi:MAG: hypothetical protein K0R54_3458 [Clostridiaceae bacterium]|jgi:DNA integrity scanning protein DisA with diadenylate cyclase activity|nr:hypothetical protein [Clostridiaceae bacterium]